MEEVVELLKIVIEKINRIYAHLEIDWDNLSEEELLKRYRSLERVLEDMKENEKGQCIKREDG